MITCDEIMDMAKSTSTKIVPTKINSTNFYILLAFLLVTLALRTAAKIYLIK